MIGIATLLVPLAVFPLVITLYFQQVIKDRKKQDVLETLERHGAWNTAAEPDIPTVRKEDVAQEFEEFYRPSSFWLPAGLLTFLYLLAACVGASYLANLGSDGPWPFAQPFLEGNVPPILIAVVSVYLFNMQHTLRRVYLSDLTPNVLWASFYRTLLVTGLAIVIAFSFPLKAGDVSAAAGPGLVGPVVYFALGFLATDVLTSLLVFAQRQLDRLFQTNRARVTEKALTMIQGINLWNAYRLEEEGIENVQQLATCNVVALTLRTHYELKTILDWADQAVLLLRLGTPDQAQKVREQCLISGAIDLAWLSAENNKEGAEAAAKRIADVLSLQPIDIQQLIDSLYEDENVRFLWYLWQSRREFDGGQSSPVRRPPPEPVPDTHGVQEQG
jgi:hypothetical protein